MASDGGNAGSTNEKSAGVVGGAGGQQPSEPDPKEGKKLFKFVFNVNKKVTDETEMTQDFLNDLKHYQEYDEAVGKCANYFENIYIPFAMKGSKPDEESFSSLGKALGEFKSYVPQNHVKEFENFSKKMHAASISRVSYQKHQAYQMKPMKAFHTITYEQFVDQRKKFDDARRKMDQAKAEVRDAKTTTAIEKKAISYQMAVDEFDHATEELIKIIEALPKVKQGYVRDLFAVMTKHKQYHIDMSKYFAASCINS